MSDQRLKSGTIAATTRTTIYTAGSNSNVRIYNLTLTNSTLNNIDVDIYVNNGTSDILIKSVTIPSGSGKVRNVYEISALAGGDAIDLEAGSADSFNYHLFGREV